MTLHKQIQGERGYRGTCDPRLAYSTYTYVNRYLLTSHLSAKADTIEHMVVQGRVEARVHVVDPKRGGQI